ncbi:DUF3558 domain-containing protein [Actinomycetospora rhizophila]|uniref:DUF3558 domain-containing protein n=1 Tax=Actinomycetospora rhizophila TaxID=1416876 RepID=A0ABV9Z6L1_9PSEU
MKHRRAVLIAICAASVAACATSRPPTEPVVQDPRHGAPAVSSPRDLATFAARPCDGPLSRQDLRPFGITVPGEQRAVPSGAQGCEWTDRTTRIEFGTVVYPDRDILVDTYRSRLFPIFVPTNIDGLPATLEQSARDSITCTITVGTAEDQGFVSTYTQLEVPAGEQPDDPCGRGQRIVERIVAALPPLQK